MDKIYPFIGANSPDATKLDLGAINSAILTVPTATKATASAAIAGAGFIAITMNGSNFNLITTLD